MLRYNSRCIIEERATTITSHHVTLVDTDDGPLHSGYAIPNLSYSPISTSHCKA